MFSLEEGVLAVRIARDVVDRHVNGNDESEYDIPPRFQEKAGAFVTIERFPSNNLRGCIGYPVAMFPLIETIQKAAKSAAAKDPRFSPIQPNELDHIVVEVSLLTLPEEIVVKKRKELLKEVVVGKHGLIMERRGLKGLLLPQVPVEWSWDTKEFLEQTCRKAMLPTNAWKDQDTKIYRFTATVFHELTPRGEVVEKSMSH